MFYFVKINSKLYKTIIYNKIIIKTTHDFKKKN